MSESDFILRLTYDEFVAADGLGVATSGIAAHGAEVDATGPDAPDAGTADVDAPGADAPGADVPGADAADAVAHAAEVDVGEDEAGEAGAPLEAEPGAASDSLAGLLAERMRNPVPFGERESLVLRLIRAVEEVRSAEGALVEQLAAAAAFAEQEAVQYSGSSLHGDAYSGVLRALAAEVAIPTAQNGRTLHRRMSDAGEFARVLPACTATVQAGALTLAHLSAAQEAAASLTRETTENADRIEALRDEFERRLLDESVTFAISPGGERTPLGTTLTPRQFGKLAARIAAELAPEAVDEAHETAMRDRRAYVQPVGPGMSALTMVGPTVLVEAAFDRLREAARALDGAAEPRTRAQREVDTAFALLIAGELDAAGGSDGSVGSAGADGEAGPAVGGSEADAAGAGVGAGDLVAVLRRIRPTVHVTVPALALVGREGAGPALLDDEHPVPLDWAAVLCGDAVQWTRVLTDPLRGVPVAADTYRPGRELRRMLRARDRHCRAPGCGVPARRCEIDHTVEWGRGGETVPENLACLCGYHHAMREYGWSLVQPEPGVLEWASPGGAGYRTTPTRIAPLGMPSPEPPPEPPTEPPPEPAPAEPAPPEPRAPEPHVPEPPPF
ncbi:MAG: hypothetical protein GXX90_07290 [Microbacteriaceae bacterium]|nr:hypothetical protein [Microbacteriaceae bacterium]